MHEDIDRVLFTEERIRSRIGELGRQIAADYAGSTLHLMTMLKGGVVLISDLMRQIPLNLEIDFIQPSSYGQGTQSKGVVDIKLFPDTDLRGKRILLLDDILDTGRTLRRVAELMRERGAADLKICVLLDKKARRAVPIEADYVGFDVPDLFVVGYGLDFADRYRNLPYIGVLRESKYRTAASED